MNQITDYIPFGPEWQAHVLKYPKSYLVDWLKAVLQEKPEIERLVLLTITLTAENKSLLKFKEDALRTLDEDGVENGKLRDKIKTLEADNERLSDHNHILKDDKQVLTDRIVELREGLRIALDYLNSYPKATTIITEIEAALHLKK